MDDKHEITPFPRSSPADIDSLRKAGDSTNAIDYRPVLLLTSAYKISTRFVPMSVAAVLPGLISA
ncbi:hypothetical protein PybrP1_012425 [[Pythium] brassicae (nom. inval.)]|nr:hypothetical protein PybrP1_012425 [[Pythium] brassicae (nom. inval.)]